MNRLPPGVQRDLLLILAVSLLVSLAGMWHIPISRNQEGRIAVSAREAVQDGHWLIPTLNGQIRLQKPPLMTWTVGLSYRAFGTINEFSARFPAWLFSLLTAWLIYGFACRLYDRYAARVAALVLLTSFEFIRHSRLAEIDIALAGAVTGAMYCWYTASQKAAGKWPWYGAGYLFCALAANLKGPAGVIVPLVSFAGFLAAARQGREFIRWLNPVGLIVCLALSSAWYGFVYWQEGARAASVFSGEMNVTFIRGADHPGAVLYYLYMLFRCAAPWTPFMYLAVILLIAKKIKSAAEWLMLAWFGLTLILLSLTPNKQPHYTLLLLPSMALLTGWLVARLGQRAGTARWIHPAVSVLVMAITAGSLLDAFWLHPRLTPHAYFDKNLGNFIRQRLSADMPLYSYGFYSAPLSFYTARKIPFLTDADLQAGAYQARACYVLTKAPDIRPWTNETEVLTFQQNRSQIWLRKYPISPRTESILPTP